jgi:hypothetical protein
LKEVTKVDEINLKEDNEINKGNNYDKEEDNKNNNHYKLKNSFKFKFSSEENKAFNYFLNNMLKKWNLIESKIFFELDKLLYIFINLYLIHKENFIKNLLRNFFNLFVLFNRKFIAYKNKKNYIELYCDQNNIKNADNCLYKIFDYFESIENFLFEIFEGFDGLNNIEKFKDYIKGKLFSFHFTIMAIYNVIKELFIDNYDCKYLFKILKQKYSNKFEEYTKKKNKSELDNDNDNDNEIKLDYSNYKNKEFSEEVKIIKLQNRNYKKIFLIMIMFIYFSLFLLILSNFYLLNLLII